MASKKIKFYVINVKLQSSKTGEDRTAAYEKLIESLTNRPHFSRLNGSEAITMYKPFVREDNGIKFYYGNLGKGISFFDKDEINVMTGEGLSKETVDKNRILEPKIGNYIYIPSKHRFGLVKEANSISVFEFEKFLKDHLSKYIDSDEKVEILSEKEPSIIDEIFKASAVFKLSYEISYTNSDALGAQGELFDELLKDNHIGKLTVTAQSDHTAQGMNIEGVDFLAGGIEVARKNGFIKSAKIIPANSNRAKIIYNQDKPLVEELTMATDNEDRNLRWFQRLINLY